MGRDGAGVQVFAAGSSILGAREELGCVVVPGRREHLAALEQRHGMVGAVRRHGGHSRPGVRGRVVDLDARGRVARRVHPSDGEDLAAREQHALVTEARGHERRAEAPDVRARVVDLGGGERVAERLARPARDQHLAAREQRRRVGVPRLVEQPRRGPRGVDEDGLSGRVPRVDEEVDPIALGDEPRGERPAARRVRRGRRHVDERAPLGVDELHGVAVLPERRAVNLPRGDRLARARRAGIEVEPLLHAARRDAPERRPAGAPVRDRAPGRASLALDAESRARAPTGPPAP